MRSGLGGHEMLEPLRRRHRQDAGEPRHPAALPRHLQERLSALSRPETLKAFLKIIDEFSYDHSERLGDAFEYLLSVLGSQGDAGQFRTPRHIIDFMVAILDPKKNETVLDPACGTAGFLISAYKHILKANTDAKGNSTLTPDEKGRLAQNFKGYDISPDMVRLSLVNLYLHGFTDPHIYEYDTLTSEDRWNEYADVILANPPFMSPKGGIKPHNRFSVQAKRSEVLFVDYMAEHLTPDGRAGIIVPEGIIFQSQTAYKALRKMLVENSLVAVVSLPAGVFQSLLRREDLHPDPRQIAGQDRATPSPSSRWRTTASASVPSAARLTRTTCRRSRPRLGEYLQPPAGEGIRRRLPAHAAA